jgi:hypothetical protein
MTLMRRVLAIVATGLGLAATVACGSLLGLGDEDPPRGNPEPETGAPSVDAAPDGPSIPDAPPDVVSAGCGPTPKPFLAAATPYALAIDNGHLYWIEGLVATATVAGCPISGCDATTFRMFPGQTTAHSIVLDGNRVFWTSEGPLDAGTVKTATKTGALATIATRSSGPRAITRAGNALLYWIEPVAGDDKIFRCELDGNGTACKDSGPTEHTAQNLTGALAADDGRVYWTEETRIAACNHELTCVDTSVDVVRNLPTQLTTMIALAGNTVFYADTTTIFANDKTVSNADPLVFAGGMGKPRALAADGGTAFWVTEAAVWAMKAGVTGGPTMLATLQRPDPNGRAGIAVDAKCVYWTDAKGGIMFRARPATL